LHENFLTNSTISVFILGTYLQYTMSDNENSGISYPIKLIPVLEEPSDWELWHRNSETWILTNDLDGVEPAGTARVVAAWKRKQKKGASALLTRCGSLAQDLGKGKETITALLAALKPTFEIQSEAKFNETFNKYEEINLQDCKSVADYNTQFQKAYTRLIKFPGVTICRTLLVRRYLNGLGPAFDGWLSTFNQTHTLLQEGIVGVGEGLIEGVSLQIAMAAASVEEQKMNHSSSVAMAAKRSGRPPQPLVDSRGTKRKQGDQHCEIHGWCKHPTANCVVKYPELEAEFKRSNPGAWEARERKKSRLNITAPTTTPTSVPPTTTLTSIPQTISHGKLAFSTSIAEATV
jgi:hypothetical protein